MPPTSVVVPGPNEETGGAHHHGQFRISDFGDCRGLVSMGVRMAADGLYWVKIYAKWSTWSESLSSLSSAGADTLVYGPTTIGDSAGEFGYVSTIFFGDIVAPAGATHWQPVIRWYSAEPTSEIDSENTGLVTGSKVRMDNLYIPDNGYPVSQQPYLDGDQPFGIWEGEPSASTSIYGEKPEPDLGAMLTMEPEFVVESSPLDLSTITQLDDDLTI